MPPKSRQNILKQLFDVKPVKEDGSLHLEKIHSVKKCLNLKYIAKARQKTPVVKLNDNFSRLPDGRVAKEVFAPILTNYYQSSLKTTARQGQPSLKSDNNRSDIADAQIRLDIAREQKEMYKELSESGIENELYLIPKSPSFEPGLVSDRQKILSELEMMLAGNAARELPKTMPAFVENYGEAKPANVAPTNKKDDFWEVVGRHDLSVKDQEFNVENKSSEEINDAEIIALPEKKKSPFSKYIIVASFLALMILGGVTVQGSINSKDEALKYAAMATEDMMAGKDLLKEMNFKGASDKFESAGENFEKSKKSIGRFNYLFLSAASSLPIVSSSKLSGINMIDAGEYMAKTGEVLSRDMAALASVNFKDVFQPNGKSEVLEVLKVLDKDLDESLINITLAAKNIDRVDEVSLPDNISKKDLIEKIRQAKSAIADGQEYLDLALGLMGAKRQKEYLLLFQNPSEIRATGGFVGSYGIVKVDNGKIKKIFVDDIFNPDGQLTEKVVPPSPIQKISTAWSMHDANWFFDFRVSAQKVAWFYEKAGGATVDAVIAINPFVIEKLLNITGPIDMSEYDTVIVSENFIDTIQYEVEEGDNKKDNKPKKILADFMPKFLEKLFAQKERIPQIVQVLKDSADGKDIMAYSFDESVQKIVSDKGFSGEILNSMNDYLAVVSSNINGYKTDRMIDSSIDLKSEIDNDGYVVNTLTIKKKHNGGNSQYDFYNKVNSDYLRVYVPAGAMLLDAKGYTIGKNKPPVDYEKLGFKKDSVVAAVESSMLIDEKTKTQIFKESGKTVFANWVFVSPGESVEVIYKYRLPQKVNLSGEYELVLQKQSGSKSKINYEIALPGNAKISSEDKDLTIDGNFARLSSDFQTDKIINFHFRFR